MRPTHPYVPVLPTMHRSSTPPNMSGTAATQDTLTHHRMTSVLPYSSINNGQFVEPAFIEAARELKNKFVLVAPDKFLAKYLPQLPSRMPSINHEAFKEVAFMRRMKRAKAKQVWIEKGMEKDMYEPMVCERE